MNKNEIAHLLVRCVVCHQYQHPHRIWHSAPAGPECVDKDACALRVRVTATLAAQPPPAPVPVPHRCTAMPPVHGNMCGVPGWVSSDPGEDASGAGAVWELAWGVGDSDEHNVVGWWLRAWAESGVYDVAFRILHCPWCGGALPVPAQAEASNEGK